MTNDRNTLENAARYLEVMSAEYAHKADYLAIDSHTQAAYNSVAKEAAKLADALRAHRCDP